MTQTGAPDTLIPTDEKNRYLVQRGGVTIGRVAYSASSWWAFGRGNTQIGGGHNTAQQASATIPTPKVKNEIPAADITADFLRATDLDTIVVVTPSGQRFGDMPSITFGLGSWDGDYDGFAAWLASRP